MNWVLVLILLAIAEALAIVCAVLYHQNTRTRWFWVLAVPSVVLTTTAFGIILGHSLYG